MKKIAVGVTVWCLLFVFPASATIIRVPQEQPTIQEGIDMALSDDTVLVMPGTYLAHIECSGKESKAN